MSDIAQRLAANLRRLRIAHRLSQSELARVTSMSKATLSGIERGRGNPTVETLASLAGALGVTIADLLEEAQLGEVRIVRASQTGAASLDGVIRRELEVVAGSHGGIELYELTLPAGHAHETPAQATGSRGGMLVLAGTLIAGPVDRISELAAGDYLSYPADVPCVYETRRTRTRAVVFTSTPT